MSRKSPILVRLFLDDARLLARWQVALSSGLFQIITAGDEGDDRSATRRTSALTIIVRMATDPQVVAAPTQQSTAGEKTAVIEIVENDAEVSAQFDGVDHVRVRRDATTAEITQICQLVAENLTLRQRLRQQRRQGRRLTRLAETDPLTGLPNRRAWERELRTRTAHRHGAGGSCLALIDLDNFKQVNEAHGLTHGDQVLIAAANALQRGIRASDFVARLGGDEFGLLLAGLEQRDAVVVLNRLRAQIAKTTTNVAQPVTASVGYVCFDQLAKAEATRLTAAADQALRQAKRSGRDRVVAADELRAAQ